MRDEGQREGERLKEATLIETEEALSNLQCLRVVIVVSMKHKTYNVAKMNDNFVPH